MGRRKAKVKIKKKLISIVLFLLITFLTVAYNNIQSKIDVFQIYEELSQQDLIVETDKSKEMLINTNETLEIHFLDVGQAESILLIQGNYSMLIDGGNDENGKEIIKYIEKQGISKLDYIIATHAHADHIGGLDKIIKHFPVEKIYFPKHTTTTKNFEEFILAVRDKNMKLTLPDVGSEFYLGSARCIVLSPELKEYEEPNNYSIVLKVIYGNTSYLLMSDAETEIENTLLENNVDITANVLKVGHHGSETSTSEKFLKAVNPKYAVISVGKDNDYNLPANKIINRLEKYNLNIYRTDLMGTIVLKSDGNNIVFEN
ncbi:MAG: MBL fold metallo-hydrolase [Clostridiales bacterium]|nr:MBL fold metallo-hydrolase [Clostridiales bacterium]